MIRRSLLAGVMLVLALGCLRGPAGRGTGARGGGGPVVTSLSEIYGADGCGAPKLTGAVTWRLTAGGATSNVPVWVPDGSGPRNAVILLHGYNGTGPGFAKSSGYITVAADHGALLVAPTAAESGSPLNPLGARVELWNNGRLGPRERDWERNDVAFLDAIATALRDSACVQNVLGTGFSDGAAMHEAWNCLSDKGPDAFVVSSASLMIAKDRCVKKPARPFRLYIGKEDPRFTGGETEQESAPTAPETAAIFAKLNGCEDRFELREEKADTSCRVYEGCRAITELCVIRDFGHAWPDGPPNTKVDGALDGYGWFVRNTKR